MPTAEANGAVTGSLLDRLRQQRASATEKKRRPLTLAIPGFTNPMILVEYQPLGWEKYVELMSVADENDPQAVLTTNLDAVINGCRRLVIAEDDDGEPVSLADKLRAAGETIVDELTFDTQTAQVLGLDVNPEAGARGVVLALFEAAVSPEVAIGQHATRLSLWMQGALLEVDATQLGESGPPRSTN